MQMRKLEWGEKSPSDVHRIQTKYILSALKKAVPGDYKALHDFRCPPLEEAGIDLSCAAVMSPDNRVSSLMFAPSLSPGSAKMKRFRENPEWHLGMVSRESRSSDGLLAMRLMESEDAAVLVSRVMMAGGNTHALMARACGPYQFVMLNGATLKAISRRADD